MNAFHITIILVVVFSFLARSIMVFIHELGHALPALWFSRQNVSVYIGSYGDARHSFRVHLGLLHIFVKYNPFTWRKGMCIPSSSNFSINQKLFYVASGPGLSILMGVIAICLSFALDAHGAVKLLSVFFLVLGINSIYQDYQYHNYSFWDRHGKFLYSDLKWIKTLLEMRNYPNEYLKAIELAKKGEYKAAADSIQSVQTENPNLLNLKMNIYVRVQRYQEVMSIYEKLSSTYSLKQEDMIIAGVALIHLKDYDGALKIYKDAIESYGEDPYSLINLGLIYLYTERYKEAIEVLNKAIKLSDTFGQAYSTRGFVKIKTGHIEEGFLDLQRASELLPSDEMVCYGFGLYYLEKGEFQKALENFQTAKELDPSIDDIDHYILMVENMKMQSSA